MIPDAAREADALPVPRFANDFELLHEERLNPRKLIGFMESTY
jgi:hypothetical protein